PSQSDEAERRFDSGSGETERTGERRLPGKQGPQRRGERERDGRFGEERSRIRQQRARDAREQDRRKRFTRSESRAARSTLEPDQRRKTDQRDGGDREGLGVARPQRREQQRHQ